MANRTSGVSKELQSRRVSVNNIAPGPMDTRKPYSPTTSYPVHVYENAPQLT